MQPNGACPSCGRVLATMGMIRAEARTLGLEDPTVNHKPDGTAKAPWHIKLMIVCLVIYLTWRLVQGIAWLLH